VTMDMSAVANGLVLSSNVKVAGSLMIRSKSREEAESYIRFANRR
jgi:hypothetical protein